MSADRELVAWLILYLGDHETLPAGVRRSLKNARAREGDERLLEQRQREAWELELKLREQADG